MSPVEFPPIRRLGQRPKERHDGLDESQAHDDTANDRMGNFCLFRPSANVDEDDDEGRYGEDPRRVHTDLMDDEPEVLVQQLPSSKTLFHVARH